MPRTVVCSAVVMVLHMVVVVVQAIVKRVRPNVGYWRGSRVVPGAAARPLLDGGGARVFVVIAVSTASTVAEVGGGADCAGGAGQRSVKRGRQQFCRVGRPHRHDRRAATNAANRSVGYRS